jgi:predicted CxxxxCH...CXXCH cytochrome family protein
VYCLVTAEPVSAAAVAAGERPDEPVYGELAEARWGFMYIQEGHREQPIYLAWPHAAFGAAWLALGGILAALFRRTVSGRGQVLTTSLLDGLAALNTQRWVGGGSPPLEPWPPYSSLNRLGDAVMIIALLECADGKWIQINSGAKGGANTLFAAVGRDDLVDPFYDEDPGAPFRTHEDAESFWATLPGAFKQQTVDAWVKRFAPTNVSAMPVLDPGDVLGLEQANRQGLVHRQGDRAEFGLAARFSRTPGRVGSSSPTPGAHNARYAADTGRDPPRTTPGEGAADGSAGPLTGLTVVDLGVQIAGPYASRLLADLGARVIKVSERNAILGRTVIGSSLGVNRGKEGITLDLKTPAGRAILLRLVERADVVHHNQRCGVLERLGLGFDTLAATNARLVSCHSSGYGNEGPWATLPAWGPMLDAIAGMLSRTGGQGNAPMHYATHVDYGGGLNTAPMILAALLARARFGEAQQVEVPQLAGAMFAMSDARIVDGELRETFAIDDHQRGHAPSNCLYRTADSGWIVLSCFSEREWTAAHSALGVTPAETFADARRRLLKPSDDETRLATAIAALSAADVVDRWTRAGVACAEPAAVAAESLVGGELERLKVVVRYRHPRAGVVFEVGHMVRFSGTPPGHTRPSPALGEHTSAVLAELGLSETELRELLETGVAVQSDAAPGPA